MINLNYDPLVILMDTRELDFCIKVSTENKFHTSKYLQISHAICSTQTQLNNGFYRVTLANDINIHQLFSAMIDAINYFDNQ